MIPTRADHDEFVDIEADTYIQNLMHDYRNATDDERARELLLFFKACWSCGFAPVIRDPETIGADGPAVERPGTG